MSDGIIHLGRPIYDRKIPAHMNVPSREGLFTSYPRNSEKRSSRPYQHVKRRSQHDHRHGSCGGLELAAGGDEHCRSRLHECPDGFKYGTGRVLWPIAEEIPPSGVDA